ncbi:MAG: L-seryl-tRNA(Sec) selenium transferase [Pirellulales bacterium]
MTKSPSHDSRALRRLPAVDKVLAQIDPLGLPRQAVVAVIRRELAALRAADEIPPPEQIVEQIRTAIAALRQGRIQPVINATGVLIHTNLGRSPLGTPALKMMVELASQYGNLEYDLMTGDRGGRAAYLEHNLALLCGAEAATVANNNAAALVLTLRHLCQSECREVIISRGELVQIGGGFRIPEILEVSGATLREVGTTNSTSCADYRQAITDSTALVLKVHQSNFFMGGFVQSPSTAELAELVHQHGLPLVEDLGSGAVVPTEELHQDLEHEPTPAESLRQGVDLVTFSGDKLFGGPQAGIVAGKKSLVASIKQEPLFRALRCDKLILVALQSLVDDYLHGLSQRGLSQRGLSQQETVNQSVPLHGMLATPISQLQQRAESLVAALADVPCQVKIQEGESRVGGGSMPRSALPSVVIALRPNQGELATLTARLREGTPPVIGYVHADQFCLNLRTVLPQQDGALINSLLAAMGR